MVAPLNTHQLQNISQKQIKHDTTSVKLFESFRPSMSVL